MRLFAIACLCCGCGGATEKEEESGNYAPDSVTFSACEPPNSVNDVTPEGSGYLWTGAASPTGYALHGAFLMEFYSPWGDRCTVEVDGAAVTSNDVVVTDSLVTICGCPFEVTFTLIEY